MLKQLLSLLLLGIFYIGHAQQNEYFKKTKDYFDYQKHLVLKKHQLDLEQETNQLKKIQMNRDFSNFMKKIDSVQNDAYLHTLILVKNKEDLSKILKKEMVESHTTDGISQSTKEENTTQAEYPGGINRLREQVAELVYTDGIETEEKVLKTSVSFVVETDGSVSFVQAEGDTPAFNRQAIIALYLLPEKFIPARVNGVVAKSRFKLPLTFRVD